MFRTAESLANEGTFAVSKDLESFSGFALRKGTDGRKYSYFGPVEEIMLVPLIKIAQAVNRSRWYDAHKELIPISHYVGYDLRQFILDMQPQDIEPHALRFLVSFFNVIICSILVVFLLLLLEKLTQSIISAGFVTVLFAFGTLTLPYSGTLFSEPLAALFILISVHFLTEIDPAYPPLTPRLKIGLLLSGIFLGLSVATHITAALFIPFFLIYTVYPFTAKRKNRAIASLNYGLFFGTGLVIILALMGYYNYIRFGSILETGRTGIAEPVNFIAPWSGLQRLFLSSGKGLLWYCPAIILGGLFWGCFKRNKPGLANMLLAVILFRILFIACCSTWHSGFGLGPRYIFVLIPFLLIPLGYFVRDTLQTNKISQLKIFCGFTLLCVSQQIYFSLGEIFSFSHIAKMSLKRIGIKPFQNDRIYLDWGLSPLFHLLEGKLGPFLLQHQQLNNYFLLLLCVAASIGLTCLFFAYLFKIHRRGAEKT